MIISRTPFRISFFGGGTDYPVWYKENKGSVLATTINKYCYITCRYLPPFFKHKSRLVYSVIENVRDLSEISHPSARVCLQHMKVKKGVEIHHDGDLPARAGLGTSSSFTVGLLHALYALKGTMPTKRQLALNAIRLEQDVMKENVGSQDQVLAAFGGFNLVEFGGLNHINVLPVTLNAKRLKSFQDHLMLVFSGFSRTASDIAGHQIKNTKNKRRELSDMQQLTGEALKILNSKTNLCDFGKLLLENWQIKRSLTKKVSTPLIDDIYSNAKAAGALGGKVLGAGGGGFVMIFAKPQFQPKIKKRLSRLLHVPFKFEDLGSQIIFYSPYDSFGSK